MMGIKYAVLFTAEAFILDHNLVPLIISWQDSLDKYLGTKASFYPGQTFCL